MERIAVVGLGYVGLPVALAFARKCDDVVGFDINARRIGDLRRGHDATGEFTAEELSGVPLRLTDRADDMNGATFFVVTVPTPIDGNNQPDLGPLRGACRSIGGAIQPGGVVVFESTVYPGVTEEICGPLIAECSGLRQGVDFTLGYSPERINPGDKEHTLERIQKIVAAADPATLDRLSAAYSQIIDAGLHLAPSIKVAEAAKVLENTQRDINIALMNELALICDRLGIRTHDVLAAARTKWNFLPFTPGLVGGHCVGVDPYYLTARAESLGYHPDVILSGRRINDSMGAYIGQRVVKLLIQAGQPVREARVGIFGITFKEDVPDTRNSKVYDIVKELCGFGIAPLVHDPLADPEVLHEEFAVSLSPLEALSDLHGLILAVPHRQYRDMGAAGLLATLRPGGVCADIRSVLDPREVEPRWTYWSL